MASSDPGTTYIDLTDATEEAIGMTGRFLRGRWRDIVNLTLIVGACFFLAMICFSRPTRDQLAELLNGIGGEFSLLGLAELLFTVIVAPIFSFGMFTWLTLLLARASFARDNLYWKCRGRSPRIIGQLGVTLHELWRDVHASRRRQVLPYEILDHVADGPGDHRRLFCRDRRRGAPLASRDRQQHFSVFAIEQDPSGLLPSARRRDRVWLRLRYDTSHRGGWPPARVK